MASVRTRSVTTDLEDEVDDVLALLGNNVGNVYYVTTTGSDSNNGTSWSTAFLTLIYAISQCTSGQRDVIFIAPGTYDETANGVNGITVDKEFLLIRGIGLGVSITNSNTRVNGRVFYITADFVNLTNLGIDKGEDTSTGAILVLADGVNRPFIINCHMHIEKAGFTGVKLTGGTTAAFIAGLGNAESRIHGHAVGAAIGIGIDFDNCNQCTTELLHLEDLTTGAVFRANGDSNLMLPETVIARCTTGISLESGASNNSIPALVLQCTTNYSDLSGNATNDRRDATTSFVRDIQHIPRFTGRIRFVSEANGLDTNSGLNPEEAFATIGNAINNSAEGDAITVEAGDYYETGLDLNLIGLELWGEIGARIYNTTGTALTVSARDCRVNEIILVANGQIALLVSGNNSVLQNITVPDSAIGCSITGDGNRLRDFIIDNPTTTGLDINGAFNDVYDVLVSNALVAARGFYLSGAGADQNTLQRCHSIGNTIAGFEVVAGANYNLFVNCSSGGGDGIRIDAGTNNVWAFYHPDSHSPQFTGNIWYVDGTDGDDTNSGETPDAAFATIGTALAAVAAGDAITVRTGTYDEDGLDMNLAGLELWCEIGTIISNTVGTECLTVSGLACRVRGVHFVQAGVIGLVVTGIGTIVERALAVNCTVGFDIDEHSTQMFNCTSAGHTVTGFDIGERNTVLRDCYANGAGANVRGFYLSNAVVTRCLFENCTSSGNATRGWEIVNGADYNNIVHSTSGGGDGKRLDNGDFNFWDIVEQLTTEHNEQMHPFSDGEGTAGLAVTVDNTATDDTPDTRSDQDYWGDTVAIILPDVLATFWNSLGIYIFATTTGKTLQWQIWFPNARFASDRNAGNVWDLGETVLTVDDGTIFLVNDYVWIRSDSHPNGEILIVTNIAGNVITVASETRFSGNTGVRYDHVGNEAMYLIYRPTDDQFTSIEGGYAAGSAKDSFRYMWHFPKEMPGNSAMIIRILNTADALDTEFDVAAIYEL